MIIELTNVTLRYPNIYAPRQFNPRVAAYPEAAIKFGTAFTLDDEQAATDITPIGMIANAKRLYSADSRYAPIVYCDDYKKLVEIMNIADARNIPRDHLLTDTIADIVVKEFDYNVAGCSGTGLALIEVHVCVEPLLKNVTEYVPIALRK